MIAIHPDKKNKKPLVVVGASVGTAIVIKKVMAAY
jgi:hypothetical protein